MQTYLSYSMYTEPWCAPSGIVLGIISGRAASCRCVSFCESHCHRSASHGRILKLGGSEWTHLDVHATSGL